MDATAFSLETYAYVYANIQRPYGQVRLYLMSAEVELRQAILIGFASRLARRMQTHNGYKTLGDRSVLAQLHPVTASIATDEDGLLPEWVVYHELIATSKNLLRKVRVSLTTQQR